MDPIVHPGMRKWISNPIHLGKCAERLRKDAKVMAAAARDRARASRDETEEKPVLKPILDTSTSAVNEGAGTSTLAVYEGASTSSSASAPQETDTPMADVHEAGKVRKTREEMAQMTNDLVGGDKFFNVKSKDKATGKGRGRKSKRQKLEEEQQIEQAKIDASIESDGESQKSEDKSITGLELELYSTASVKEYFSDFSELTDDSEDAGSSDYTDFDNNFEHYMTRDDTESENEHDDFTKNEDPIFETTTGAADSEANNDSTKNEFTPFKKDEQFQAFMERVSKVKIGRELEFCDELKIPMMEALGISEEKFKRLERKACPAVVSVLGETFQEEAVVEGSVMPVLAPPLPDAAKAQLQSLAIFVTHGDDPTGFQWRSNNVQQQINDDILNMAFKERMAQQEIDYKQRKRGLVDKDRDFLIELTVYQATDPDETLPDEAKVRKSYESRYSTENLSNSRGGGDSEGDLGPPISGPTRYMEPKIAYKMEILGSQTVADLRDNLHCENDLVCVHEVFNPETYVENPKDLAKNNFQSAMVLIHDVIYSDFRKRGGLDYAEKINKWAATPPKKNIGPFKKGIMETTTLSDLTLRFGYPYLYAHLANCEHILVFNKARLLQKEDEHRLSHYPRRITSSYFKNTYCRVDNEYLAKWAVFDFDEFPENPMMVCGDCLKMYCYDGKGEKRGSFRLFPFRQLANEM